jgi:hypothetical protein
LKEPPEQEKFEKVELSAKELQIFEL